MAMHPFMRETLRVGIGVVARGSARFMESVLKDAAEAFRAGERKAKQAKDYISREVFDDDSWDR